MNDDMLSQEEINELLKSVGGDEEANNTDSEEGNDGQAEKAAGEPKSDVISVKEYLDVVEQDALGEIGNISFGSAATALSQLLNQKVDITTPEVSLVYQKSLDDEFPQPHVAVHVKYTDGFEGTNVLVIRTTDAAIIADLMLGGDGRNADDELEEMHISAVQEAMNQMMGSASTSMSTIFNKRVDISPPGIDVLDIKHAKGTESIPADDVLVKISFRLKIGDLIDSSIMQLVTVPFAKQMVKELMNPENGSDEEPASSESVPPDSSPAEPELDPAIHTSPSKQKTAENASFPKDEQQLVGKGQHPHPSKMVQSAEFSSFRNTPLKGTEAKNLDMLLDIPLDITVELGRTKRSIKSILELTQGSIIELDKLAGEPVDILVNQKLVAKGEVVVIDENFGVRVTDIVSPVDRIQKLK